MNMFLNKSKRAYPVSESVITWMIWLMLAAAVVIGVSLIFKKVAG